MSENKKEPEERADLDFNENSELQLKDTIKSLEDKNLRLAADFENLRTRMEKEKADALKYGAMKFSQDIISVADMMEMAMQSIQSNAEMKTVVSGVEMIQKEIINVFDRHNIKKFESLNQPFDPQKHEAMMEIEDGDAPDNTVVKEMKSGYMMADRLLRPALVAVKKPVVKSED